MFKKAQQINPFILADISNSTSSNITSFFTAATQLHRDLVCAQSALRGTDFKNAKESTVVTKMGSTKRHQALPAFT